MIPSAALPAFAMSLLCGATNAVIPVRRLLWEGWQLWSAMTLSSPLRGALLLAMGTAERFACLPRLTIRLTATLGARAELDLMMLVPQLPIYPITVVLDLGARELQTKSTLFLAVSVIFTCLLEMDRTTEEITGTPSATCGRLFPPKWYRGAPSDMPVGTPLEEEHLGIRRHLEKARDLFLKNAVTQAIFPSFRLL